MVHFIIKLLVYPALVYLSDLLFRGVLFTSFNQILLVGWTLSILSYIADVALLERYSNIVLTATDFIMAFSIIMIYQYFMPVAVVSFTGALATALLLAASEYAIHAWIIKTRAIGEKVK